MSEYKALSERGYNDFWGEDNPRCPHCGESIDIVAHDMYELYSEDCHDGVYCPHCDGVFSVETCIKHTFNTDEQPSKEDL